MLMLVCMHFCKINYRSCHQLQIYLYENFQIYSSMHGCVDDLLVADLEHPPDTPSRVESQVWIVVI